MKNILLCFLTTPLLLHAQQPAAPKINKSKDPNITTSIIQPDPTQPILKLIDDYALARSTKDTALLEEILTPEIDQLVSSGEWRRGKETAMKGMLRSSTRAPGKRSLKVETIRMVGSQSGIVDARYEIENSDGSIRKMWSTFIVVFRDDRWKIAAIRNMLPAKR